MPTIEVGVHRSVGYFYAQRLMYCWQLLLRRVEAPDGTSAVVYLEVHEMLWAVPVPAEERILPTAFPLSSEKKTIIIPLPNRRPFQSAGGYRVLSEAHIS